MSHGTQTGRPRLLRWGEGGEGVGIESGVEFGVAVTDLPEDDDVSLAVPGARTEPEAWRSEKPCLVAVAGWVEDRPDV